MKGVNSGLEENPTVWFGLLPFVGSSEGILSGTVSSSSWMSFCWMTVSGLAVVRTNETRVTEALRSSYRIASSGR